MSKKYETLANFGDALVYLIINLFYSYHHAMGTYNELEPRPEQNQQGRIPRWIFLLSPVASSSPGELHPGAARGPPSVAAWLGAS